MSNALYDTGRNAFLNAGINYGSDTIKMVPVTSGYTVNLATDQYLSIIGSNTVGTAQVLSGKSSSAGVATCAAITFSSVPGGSTIIAFVVYKDTGVAGTSQLIAYIDTLANGSVNIPTNGGNIVVTPDSGPNALFKL